MWNGSRSTSSVEKNCCRVKSQKVQKRDRQAGTLGAMQKRERRQDGQLREGTVEAGRPHHFGLCGHCSLLLLLLLHPKIGLELEISIMGRHFLCLCLF